MERSCAVCYAGIFNSHTFPLTPPLTEREWVFVSFLRFPMFFRVFDSYLFAWLVGLLVWYFLHSSVETHVRRVMIGADECREERNEGSTEERGGVQTREEAVRHVQSVMQRISGYSLSLFCFCLASFSVSFCCSSCKNILLLFLCLSFQDSFFPW